MNWDKAKNLAVIFLLVLNIILVIFNQTEKKRYVINKDQVRSITNILSNNSINFDAKIIESYKPMQQISLSPAVYNYESLLDIYFSDTDKILRLDEYDKLIFVFEDMTLTVQNEYVTFERSFDNWEEQASILNDDDALTVCEDFMRKIGEDYKSFTLDTVVSEDGNYRIIYRQKYRNLIIYSNYVEFIVTQYGISLIESVLNPPKGYSGSQRNICSPDEALFTLIQEIKNSYGNKPVTVTTMDIVYFQDDFDSDGNLLKATPYYRFSIEGQENPYLINAYINAPL